MKDIFEKDRSEENRLRSNSRRAERSDTRCTAHDDSRGKSGKSNQEN